MAYQVADIVNTVLSMQSVSFIVRRTIFVIIAALVAIGIDIDVRRPLLKEFSLKKVPIIFFWVMRLMSGLFFFPIIVSILFFPVVLGAKCYSAIQGDSSLGKEIKSLICNLRYGTDGENKLVDVDWGKLQVHVYHIVNNEEFDGRGKSDLPV